MQDSQGIIWFGTQDGLNKFDGYDFTVIRHEPFDNNTLSSNYIWDIAEDKNGDLCLATQLGFNIYSKKDGFFKTFYNNQNDSNSISSNIVYNILVDSENRIWVKTDCGFDEFIKESDTFKRYNYYIDSTTFLSSYNNLALFEDSKNRIWVGTKDGLNYFDKNTGKFKRYFYNETNINSISNNEITEIFEDSNNNLWIGTQNGLNKFDLNTNSFEKYFYYGNNSKLNENIISSIFETPDGIIWIGTDNGLKTLNIEQEQIQNIDYEQIKEIKDKTAAIVSDFSGILWIGTWEGVYKVDIRPKKFEYFGKTNNLNSINLTNNYIHSIYVDNLNQIWAGSSGINIINRETNKVININPNKKINDTYVFSFLRVDENNLFVGTNNGLFSYNFVNDEFLDISNLYKSENKNLFVNNRISAMKKDSLQNIWLGTYNGLYRIKNSEVTVFTKSKNQSSGLTSNEIYSLLVDKDGFLWVGTLEGLNKYDANSNTFKWYTYNPVEGKGLSNNSILSLFEDSEGFLWIGTESGLNKFDKKNETYEYFTCKKTGFVNDYIYAILEDNIGNLWLSTNNGIVKFNKKTHAIQTFGKKDGLQDYEFNLGACYLSKKGEMFFGGVNGINSFFPDSMITNKVAPKAVITKFLKSNKLGEIEIYFDTINPIILDFHDNFTIYFSVPEYTKPQENLFQYKLQGIIDDWTVPSNQHFANFSQLKPGEYTFLVKGSNSDNSWNNEPAIVKIIINPPLYRTSFAYIIYIIIGILLVLFVFMYVTQNMRKENQILLEKNKASQQVELQRKELEIKNKNITDSIHYAKIIIDAMLLSENMLQKIIPTSFILFLPKDIVSGDFYWFMERNDKMFIAAVDCTGHGVPGAFMSIVGLDLFRNIINKGIYDPAEILNQMNEEVAVVFEPKEFDKTLRDGMDLSFCVIDKNTKVLTFAGAYNPLYIIRDNSLTELKADRFSVGLISKNEKQAFKSSTFHLQDDDVIYLFSDGYTDQFGGTEAKKFKFRRFRHLLLSIHQLPFKNQKQRLIDAYDEWRNGFEQVDDILIIGLKPFNSDNYRETYY